METNSVILESFEQLTQSYGESVLDGMQGALNTIQNSQLGTSILGLLSQLILAFIAVAAIWYVLRLLVRALRVIR